MKKVLIITSIFLASCSNNTKHHHTKTDTTKVNVVYVIGDSIWKRDTSFRIIRDTLKPSKKDSTRNEWQRDTIYFVPILVDSVTKKVNWYGVTPRFVQEVHVLPIK